MAQATKAFDAATIADLSRKINVFLAANPASVIEAIAMTENTGSYYAIVGYQV